MRTLLLICCVFFVGQLSAAENCHLTLKHDLRITAQDVSLQAEEQPLWRISNSGQLWLAEQLHPTDASTAALLQQYQQSVRQQAFSTLNLVNNALQLATSALEQTFAGLTGQSDMEQSALQPAFAHLRQSLDLVVRQQGDTLLLNGSKLEQLDQAFGPEFDAAMEDMVQQLMGNMLMHVGKSMLSGSGSFEDRMNAFGERMETMGEQLEQNMQGKALALEEQAATLCAELEQLQQLERQLQQQLPAMQPFTLVTLHNTKAE